MSAISQMRCGWYMGVRGRMCGNRDMGGKPGSLLAVHKKDVLTRCFPALTMEKISLLEIVNSNFELCHLFE